MNTMKISFAAVCILLVFAAGCSPWLTREQRQALTEIMAILNTAIAETEEIISRKPDPTSPYRELADKLREIREHVSRIKEGKDPYDLNVMSKYTNEVLGIQMNVQNPVDRILGVDVFFGPGRYKISELSEEGKEMLRAFASDIVEMQVKKLRAVFPDQPLSIVIRTIGYADEMPMSPWFAEALKKDIHQSVPEDPAAARQILNRELSFRRAQSIGEYVKMQLESVLTMEKVTVDTPIHIGMGEALPYAEEPVEPPYMPQDKRRRICKIHGNVFVAPADL